MGPELLVLADLLLHVAFFAVVPYVLLKGPGYRQLETWLSRP